MFRTLKVIYDELVKFTQGQQYSEEVSLMVGIVTAATKIQSNNWVQMIVLV